MIQGGDEPNTRITMEEFSVFEHARFAVCLTTDYNVFQEEGPVADNQILPGYFLLFEKMEMGEGLMGMVCPDDVPIMPENMVLAFTVTLKEKDDSKEQKGLSLHGGQFLPEPPYCSVTPQYLYETHRERLPEIMFAVRGYALVWLALANCEAPWEEDG